MAKFLNVYNFIPFPDKKEENYKEKGNLTGVINYTIKTKSPLFIPNSSNNDAFQFKTDPEKGKEQEKHPSYDFYSYREKPVIPGSELRGMVRNIYETLTDSCMGVLNGNKVPVIRPGTTSFLPGLLVKKDHGYEIQKAFSNTYVGGKEKLYLSNQYSEGQLVYISREREDGYVKLCSVKRTEACKIPGYIIKGISDGKLNKKKGVRVFVQNLNDEKTIKVSEKDIERLEAVIKSYQSENKENYMEYEKCLSDFKINKDPNKGPQKMPVYYSITDDEKLLYLSPACITKELSHYSVEDMAGNMASCKDNEIACPACDLFGRIGSTNENAKASSIRFTDATLAESEENKRYYDKIVTLPTLAEPKLGCTEFYLQKPENACFWTYDYFIKRGNDNNTVLFTEQGTLRGRKFYWHQPNITKVEDLPKKVKKTKLNKTIRPVAKDITFEGKVYFEGISNTQLQQLAWILNGGEDGKLTYKLGGGKPFGLGSVECKVTSIFERKITLDGGSVCYTEEPLGFDTKQDLKFSTKCKNAFMFMSNYDAINIIKGETREDVVISYPVTEQQYNALQQNGSDGGMVEGYKWFMENHKNPKRLHPRGYGINESLPELKFDKNGKLIANLKMSCFWSKNRKKE